MAYKIDPDIIVNSVVLSMISSTHSSLTERLWAKFLSQFPVVPAHLYGMDCSTMCTDGMRIYYSPEFVRNICLDVIEEGKESEIAKKISKNIKFILAHEVMHIIDKHVAKDTSDILFKVPPPYDESFEVLRGLVGEAQDSIINARLKKEFGQNPPVITRRDEQGNIIERNQACLYDGEEMLSWTNLFVAACNEMTEAIAGVFGIDIDIQRYPNNFYESIDLFRKVFYQLPKNIQEKIADAFGQQQPKQMQGQPDGSEQGSEKNKEGKGSTSGEKDELAENIIDAVKKAKKEVLNGDATLDDHEKSEELFANTKKHITQTKIDRAMDAIKAEIERSGIGAGTGKSEASILISLCEKYFRPKPEPWYLGISMLMKSKVNEGRQVRERIPPLEMLSQAMSGTSIIHYERQCRQLNLAFAVDVSGSMDNEEVLSGVLKILEYLEREIPAGSQGHKFIFCQVDAGIEEWKEMTVPSYEYMEWKENLREKGFVRKGYGGTEFAPFFGKLNEENIRPDAVVVFSDMGLYDFDKVAQEIELYSQNVIWLCCSKEVPDEFYKYELGRVYETQSLFDEIREEQVEMER